MTAIPGVDVLRVLAVVAEATEDEGSAADHREAEAQTRTGNLIGSGLLRLKLLPLPSARLKTKPISTRSRFSKLKHNLYCPAQVNVVVVFASLELAGSTIFYWPQVSIRESEFFERCRHRERCPRLQTLKSRFSSISLLVFF